MALQKKGVKKGGSKMGAKFWRFFENQKSWKIGQKRPFFWPALRFNRQKQLAFSNSHFLEHRKNSVFEVKMTFFCHFWPFLTPRKGVKIDLFETLVLWLWSRKRTPPSLLGGVTFAIFSKKTRFLLFFSVFSLFSHFLLKSYC